jgi:hypothetical protein
MSCLVFISSSQISNNCLKPKMSNILQLISCVDHNRRENSLAPSLGQESSWVGDTIPPFVKYHYFDNQWSSSKNRISGTSFLYQRWEFVRQKKGRWPDYFSQMDGYSKEWKLVLFSRRIRENWGVSAGEWRYFQEEHFQRSVPCEVCFHAHLTVQMFQPPSKSPWVQV